MNVLMWKCHNAVRTADQTALLMQVQWNADFHDCDDKL